MRLSESPHPSTSSLSTFSLDVAWSGIHSVPMQIFWESPTLKTSLIFVQMLWLYSKNDDDGGEAIQSGDVCGIRTNTQKAENFLPNC